MYRSFSPTYMKTHIFEIAWSLAGLGSHIYPGKAVTEQKVLRIRGRDMECGDSAVGSPKQARIVTSHSGELQSQEQGLDHRHRNRNCGRPQRRAPGTTIS